jgi:hypothetical protein
MGAGPVLICRNIGMPASNLLAARHAPPYLHPELRHYWLGGRRDVGDVSDIHSLILELPSAYRADVRCHLHVHRRSRNLIGRRRLPVAERAFPWLATRSLGVGRPRPLGERSALTLASTLEVGDLLVQLFYGCRRFGKLLLESANSARRLAFNATGSSRSQEVRSFGNRISKV